MASTLTTSLGSPTPLGATVIGNGVNFAVYAFTEDPIYLNLYEPGSSNKMASYDLKRTGNIYHIFIEGAQPGSLYAYEINGKGPFLDPYATNTNSEIEWGSPKPDYRPLGVVPLQTPYDWGDDKPPHIPKEKLIIYEMHIRGLTKDISSLVQHPGSYLGVIEKIDHLKELGVNAVELLPLFEFNEGEYGRPNPVTLKPLCNYWGYSTVNFFSPMNRYASQPEIGSAQKDLKDMIKALHANGIEVILDVVYNHSSEGNEQGPALSFKGFDNATYYMLDEEGHYLNFSGCGNTFNCNSPIVREYILQSLRHWVTEYRVDGFRFDLASILSRAENGAPLFNPPLVEAITKDPILANVKLIAEAWDAVGFYQVGNFYTKGNRWSEWNGTYRDVVRRFLKGTHGLKGEFATKLSGSRDLYFAQSPSATVNFITCHDGFTLADLVSYNQKHNLDNGENNQDGSSWNDSWNCGVEGPTSEADVLDLRQRQMRNFHIALMMSQGIPMMHMGDEYGHSKQGNNNTWCQDNTLSWFQWDQLAANQEFYNFYKEIVAFRKSHPHFYHKEFITGKDVQWHGVQPDKPEWEEQDCFLAFTLLHEDSHLYIAFNATDVELEVILPEARNKAIWRLITYTGGTIDPPLAVQGKFKMKSFSSLILKS